MQQRTLKANVSQYRGVASVSRLRRCTPQRMFERQAAWAAQAASEMTTTLSSTVKNASARFARLFPLWITGVMLLGKLNAFQVPLDLEIQPCKCHKDNTMIIMTIRVWIWVSPRACDAWQQLLHLRSRSHQASSLCRGNSLLALRSCAYLGA